MQIKFNDGTTLDVLAVNGNPVYFQGTNRDSLEIQIDKSKTTFDALDTLTGNAANTSKLTIIDGDHQYEHDNYSLRTELALKPIVTAAATDTAPEQTEDRLCVTLAQITYAELQAAQLAAAQMTQAEAIAELSILVAGGEA